MCLCYCWKEFGDLSFNFHRLELIFSINQNLKGILASITIIMSELSKLGLIYYPMPEVCCCANVNIEIFWWPSPPSPWVTIFCNIITFADDSALYSFHDLSISKLAGGGDVLKSTMSRRAFNNFRKLWWFFPSFVGNISSTGDQAFLPHFRASWNLKSLGMLLQQRWEWEIGYHPLDTSVPLLWMIHSRLAHLLRGNRRRRFLLQAPFRLSPVLWPLRISESRWVQRSSPSPPPPAPSLI